METEESEKLKISTGASLVNIIIAEFILAAIILISSAVIKYLFKPTYKEICNWYETNITCDTDINEVIK